MEFCLNALSLNFRLLFDSLVIALLIRYWRLWQFTPNTSIRLIFFWNINSGMEDENGNGSGQYMYMPLQVRRTNPLQETTVMELRNGIIDPENRGLDASYFGGSESIDAAPGVRDYYWLVFYSFSSFHLRIPEKRVLIYDAILTSVVNCCICISSSAIHQELTKKEPSNLHVLLHLNQLLLISYRNRKRHPKHKCARNQHPQRCPAYA